MGHLLSSAIKMQSSAELGTISVTNTDASGCSFPYGVINGSIYVNQTNSPQSIAAGDVFSGNNGADCYGQVCVYVYSNLRGYLYTGCSGIEFAPGIYSGDFTRITGENITITGSFFASEPPPPCFIAGTMIRLADGTDVAIETLSEGIELESVLIDTLEDTNDVFKLYKWSSPTLLETRTSSKVSRYLEEVVDRTIIVNGGLLQATYNHTQLARVNGIWRMIMMEHLAVGDMLYDSNGNLIEVTDVEVSLEPITVYRLTLSDVSHTYFANNILTHNIKDIGFE